MPSYKSLATAAASTLRARLRPSLRTRGGGETAGKWEIQGHEDAPKAYLFNRTPPPPGQSRKWEDWELPCYIAYSLAVVILGVGLTAKPDDLTIEAWAHKKALERLKEEEAQAAESD